MKGARPIHARHHHVQKDEVGGGLDSVEGSGAVPHTSTEKPPTELRGELVTTRTSVVLHEQDAGGSLTHPDRFREKAAGAPGRSMKNVVPIPSWVSNYGPEVLDDRLLMLSLRPVPSAGGSWTSPPAEARKMRSGTQTARPRSPR
jgi:hypothetical protein